MENLTPNHNEDPSKTDVPVETNYAAHKNNPGPGPTVNEPDNKGAGQAMKWIIPIVIVILLVVWFFFFKNNTSA
jgi:ATP-dependent Zn protease